MVQPDTNVIAEEHDSGTDLDHRRHIRRRRRAGADTGVMGILWSALPGSAAAKRIVALGDVHGGLLPLHLDYGIERLNRDVGNWLLGTGEAPPFIHTRESPTWARNYSDEVDSADCLQLEDVLGRVWCIDAGLSEYYGGRIEVLEISGDRVQVLR